MTSIFLELIIFRLRYCDSYKMNESFKYAAKYIKPTYHREPTVAHENSAISEYFGDIDTKSNPIAS